MKVLFVTSEVTKLYKRGGLADVSYSLPAALSDIGVNISIAMPFYERMSTKNVACVGQMALDYDRRRELLFIFRTTLPGTTVPVYLFRHPILNHYDGGLIVERFAFFSKAVTQLYLYSQETMGGPYDILHCNDWHTALIPLLVGEHRKVGYHREEETIQSKRAKTVLTIHNLLYRGETGVSIALKLGLPQSVLHVFSTPLGQAVRLMEEGMEYVDCVTTVSPTYATEIMAGEHGKSTVNVFTRRADAIVGILNGIDGDAWDPRTDKELPRSFNARTVIPAKAVIKKSLQHALRLPVADVPLFGFVGRFERRQKGLDLIAKAIAKLPGDLYQVALLGTGQKSLIQQFIRLAAAHPNVAFTHTFDERLAKKIYAGADIMLVPSKFEPCGLTQMIAMRYGTIPLVRKTGGLADSVKDGVTGFVFKKYGTSALVVAMERAMAAWQKNGPWNSMVKAAMRQDFSWKRSAREYLGLYRRLLGQ